MKVFVAVVMVNKEDADSLRTLGTFFNREDAEKALKEEMESRERMGSKYHLYAGKVIEQEVK